MAEFLRDLASFASVLGAALYGLAWIFATAFFEQFALSPSDVGADFVFLLSRTGAIVFVVVTVAFIPSHLFGLWMWRDRGRRGDLSAFHLLTVGGAATLSTVFIVAVAVASTVTVFVLIVLVYVVLGVTAFAAALEASGYTVRTGDGAVLTDASAPGGAAFATAFVLLALALSALFFGQALGKSVLSGNPVDLYLFRVTPVEVRYQNESGNPVKTDPCISLLLGTKDGSVIVFDALAQTTNRITAEAITVRSAVSSFDCDE